MSSGHNCLTDGTATREVGVRVFRIKAHLTVVINNAEWDRRNRAGLGALTGLAMLDGLLNLPFGLPVDIADLTTTERRLLARVPDSVVEHRALIDATVIRRVQPVLTVLAASVRVRSWRSGLARVSRFIRYCPRSLVLLRELVGDERDDACLECSYYGVGLSMVTRDGPVSLVAPQPMAQCRVSAAGWWFTEEVYRQLTRAGAR